MVNTESVPARNIVKIYVENGYYHIYNRGVEKRTIFLDEQDCKVFLHYIKLYLSPIEELRLLQGVERINRFIPLNLSKEIDLLTFSLMPNHIHLQVKQHTKTGITKLMRRLMTSYVMYFNKKYERVGALFQNKYKAILVDTDSYLLHLSRYIHRNSFGLESKIPFTNYSSLPYYLRSFNANWIKPKEILEYFQSNRDRLGRISYKEFIETENENSEAILGDLLLEDD